MGLWRVEPPSRALSSTDTHAQLASLIPYPLSTVPSIPLSPCIYPTTLLLSLLNHPPTHPPTMTTPAKQIQMERAMDQIAHRGGPLPEIDFTQHQLEDGSYVATNERVIKDVFPFPHSLQ